MSGLPFSPSFFFSKQKTAYELRISDWSSDVCSSDLLHPRIAEGADYVVAGGQTLARDAGSHHLGVAENRRAVAQSCARSRDDTGSSAKRRVRKGWVSPGNSWWSPFH